MFISEGFSKFSLVLYRVKSNQVNVKMSRGQKLVQIALESYNKENVNKESVFTPLGEFNNEKHATRKGK